MKSNFTTLEDQLEDVKAKFEGFVKTAHEQAEGSFQQFDKNRDMKDQEKDELFTKHTNEFKSSLKLLQ